MSHTSVVFALDSEYRFPLVREPEWDRLVWKLPGGRSEDSETPEETASRELFEEAGLSIPPEDLKLVAEEDRDTHMFYLFMPEKLLNHFNGLRERGIEGEVVDVFNFDYMRGEIKEDIPFLETHLRVLRASKVFA